MTGSVVQDGVQSGTKQALPDERERTDAIDRLQSRLMLGRGAAAGREERVRQERRGTRRKEVTDSGYEKNERFERGLALRKEVLGSEHVERSLARAEEDPFLLPIQQIAVEFGWGEVWSRPGLPRKTRSFLSIAYLAAQGKTGELGAHVAGAVRNGASREEIREVLLQAALYCGMPVGLEAFRVAKRALDDLEAAGGNETTAAENGES